MTTIELSSEQTELWTDHGPDGEAFRRQVRAEHTEGHTEVRGACGTTLDAWEGHGMRRWRFKIDSPSVRSEDWEAYCDGETPDNIRSLGSDDSEETIEVMAETWMGALKLLREWASSMGCRVTGARVGGLWGGCR